MADNMQNAGPEQPPRAEMLRSRFTWLQSIDDSTLAEISSCNVGEQLQPGETYFDVSHPERGIIEGGTADRVPDEACFVAKSTTRPDAWDKLVRSFKENMP
jgi:hypothetical protein